MGSAVVYIGNYGLNLEQFRKYVCPELEKEFRVPDMIRIGNRAHSAILAAVVGDMQRLDSIDEKLIMLGRNADSMTISHSDRVLLAIPHGYDLYRLVDKDPKTGIETYKGYIEVHSVFSDDASASDMYKQLAIFDTALHVNDQLKRMANSFNKMKELFSSFTEENQEK